MKCDRKNSQLYSSVSSYQFRALTVPTTPVLLFVLLGNNFYGDEMIEKLNTLSADELVMFTLMEKISPPLNTNYIISGIQGELRPQQLVSELGIFGAILV